MALARSRCLVREQEISKKLSWLRMRLAGHDGELAGHEADPGLVLGGAKICKPFVEFGKSGLAEIYICSECPNCSRVE